MIIGLDVGGTHADVVLLGKEGLIREVKVPTDPTNLFDTVLTCLDEIAEGIKPSDIHRMVLSTTLTTNAIIQRQTAPVGMIVAGGPGLDPEFFRTNQDYYPVTGSIDHRGREIEPIDPEQIKKISCRMAKTGIRNVGVISKFSIRNPEHEIQIARLLDRSFEKIFMGHHVSGYLNFPRRIATTYLNAAVYPIHKNFFNAVKKSLEKKGLNVPIHVLKADGGTMSFDASMDFPGQTILSGPAASVMGSIAFAPDTEESLVLDIGGTTTDMAILIGHVPLLNPLGINLGPYKTLIRSLETHSIGIGGDSAVAVKNGRLTIGPERLGKPVAFDGPVPTPSDAMLVLGMMKNGDRDKAARGLEDIAHQLGLTIEDTAMEIFDLACKTILKEAGAMIENINSKPVYTIHDLLEGHTVKPKKMLVLGGPALHFAKHFEKISDYEVGVVPRWKVANAIGAALARTTCEVTLFADTQQGIAAAPEENFYDSVARSFSKKDAIRQACSLLEKKAMQIGSHAEDFEIEVIEDMEFNMVRGFTTTGKNIRVKVQVKPGLIHGYDPIAGMLLEDM
ncbi:MAG: hydantoinase/oxoprolinase family protein [Deltaproteobacteria bacterium]|nr:hydantoinase/oxoprolinase family protein [Deltaproteobacteria bacterium]